MIGRAIVNDAVSSGQAERVFRIYRHGLAVRIAHWVGVLSVTLLLMSGLQIFNAHPALYWGEVSDFAHPAASVDATVRNGTRVGVTNILCGSFATTGFLGLSGSADDPEVRAFPRWSTLPADQDLATGRRWHFFFAWIFLFDGLIYFLVGMVRGHIWRDLIPSRQGLENIGRTLLDHLRLRFPKGAEAKHYNVLQQLSYLVIIFGILPALFLTGLTMSPGLDAAFPWLTAIFDGRQSARTLHFIAAALLVGFVIIHIIMVLLSGAGNNMRSMITGWYAIKPARDPHER